MESKFVVIITIHADPAMAPGFDEWGGTHTYMRELLEDFGKYHIRAVMFTRKCMDYLPDVEKYNEYTTVYRLKNGDSEPIDKNLLYKYHEYNCKSILKIIQSIEGTPVAIHSVYWNSGRIGIKLSEQLNIPFVHSVISNEKGRIARGATSYVDFRIGAEQEIYNKAKFILCVSEDEKKDLINLYNVKPDKLIVAGQEVDDSFILPCHDKNNFPKLHTNISRIKQEHLAKKYNLAYQINTDDNFWVRKSFTYLGRVYYNKGVDVIFAAWHKLYTIYKESTPSLWIIGGSLKEISETRKQLKKEFTDLDYLEQQQKVIWWGCLDFQTISSILTKSLALIMHSFYEPGGRVIVEAMSTGIPVIATPNGFGRDYIYNWKNGFTVQYGDINELCTKLELFVRQPYLSDSLGSTAKEYADIIIEKWDFFYNHLYAYGLRPKKNSLEHHQVKNYVSKCEINLFPYYNEELTKRYIENFVSTSINENILTISNFERRSTSHIYEIQTTNSYFILKEVINRFSASAYFNPFNYYLVRNKINAYYVEKESYLNRLNKNLIAYDDEKKLFLLKKYKDFDNYSLNEFQLMLNYILKNCVHPTLEEYNKYNLIMSSITGTYESIMNAFKELETLDKYYFECSGLFSVHLVWKLAPYILDYNTRLINKKTYIDLKKYSDYFLSIYKFTLDIQNIMYVNIDANVRHFLQDENENVVMIDLEKTCIGDIESTIACLLFDFLNNRYILFKDTLCILNEYQISIKKIIYIISYRIFYEIIHNEIKGLNNNHLWNILEEIYCYSKSELFYYPTI